MLSGEFDKFLAERPWLLGLIVVIGIGLSILIITVAVHGLYDKPLINYQSARHAQPVETVNQKSDRLAIMNLVNRFNQEENALSDELTDEERTAKKIEHIRELQMRLEKLDVEDTLIPAKQDLLAVFADFQQRLETGQETGTLWSTFRSIGDKYPWLNALMFIILINRL